MTDTAQEQMEILAGALPFLKRYDDQIVVVKYGGHAMGEEETALRFGRDIALLEQVGGWCGRANSCALTATRTAISKKCSILALWVSPSISTRACWN